MKTNIQEKNLEIISELFISKIEELQKNDTWDKPWVNVKQGVPMNIRGSAYEGTNGLFLTMLAEKKRYKLPVFLTFNQAREQNVLINKGEKSFPVFYKDKLIFDIDGNKIEVSDFLKMPQEKKKEYIVRSYVKTYNIFNIEQTNCQEINPELWLKLIDQHAIKLEEKNYSNEPLSIMLAGQNWDCEIKIGGTNNAFYKPGDDYIHIPYMEQFKSETAFFGTLLHEMAHSTGHSSRLNRNLLYGHEELIAEMAAAMTGISLGTQVTISKDNAIYLQSWLNGIKQDKHFIYNCAGDALKASRYICDKVDLKTQLQQSQENLISIGAAAENKEIPIIQTKENEFVIEQKIFSENNFKKLAKITCFGGVDLSKEQQKNLLEGKPTFVRNIENAKNEKRNAWLVITKDKDIKICNNIAMNIGTQKLSGEQVEKLRSGQVVYMHGLPTRDGEKKDILAFIDQNDTLQIKPNQQCKQTQSLQNQVKYSI